MRRKPAQQPAEIRIKNFLEVALGFSKKDAEKEALRCLQCKDPACVQGCPVEIDIPAFIKLIKDGKVNEALEKIKQKIICLRSAAGYVPRRTSARQCAF